MLQNKKVNIIIAIVAAVCLWAYVTGTIDPNASKRFVSVPIEIINESSLTENGLAINATSELNVDITITGKRGDINKVDKEDIKVTADMYGRHKGDNHVDIDVQVPKSVDVDSKSADKIFIDIDDLVSEEKEIKVKVHGKLDADTVLGETEIYPKKMMVVGTQENVDKVKYVSATVDAGKLKSKQTTQQASVEAVNKEGKEVKFVHTSHKTVEVKTNIKKYKKVPLKVKTVGEVDGRYEVEAVTVPKEIEIVGSAKELDKISEIRGEDIDISKVEKSTKLAIKPILPNGIAVKDDKTLYVDVKIKKQESKIFQFASEEIKIINLSQGLQGEVETAVTVEISGKITDISDLQKKDIEVYIDGNNMDEGVHQADVSVKVQREKVYATSSPKSIKLTISGE